MFYDKITQIEFELTTRCNASCPQCIRNYYGGKTWHTLPIVDLGLDWIKSKFTEKELAHMKEIRLCGTYGDPCIHPDLIGIIKYFHSVSQAQITIRTNGSLRNETWWKELATALRKDDVVFFGIDGLEDTNHLYRIGTDFNKIIKNAKIFIQNGGNAVWSFIAFEHNQHQVDQARNFSTDLGFKGFVVKFTSRFIDKAHKKIDASPVHDKNNNIIRWIKPATDKKYLNKGYDAYDDIVDKFNNYDAYLKSTSISCMAKKTGLVCVSAEGYVLPCGWLLDRFYGYEPESHTDRAKLFEMIENNGSLNSIDLNYTAFADITNSKIFNEIKDSWTNSNRLDRCAHQCGESTLLNQASVSEIKNFVQGDSL